MIGMDDFPQVQRAVRKVHQSTERAVGAANQLLEQIKEEFGVKTSEQARELVEQFRVKMMAKGKKYNQAMVEFKRENMEVLREIGGFTGEDE